MSKDHITAMPTKEQEAWLRENYKLYNRYHLAKHLGVSDKKLTIWFHHLGLSKRNGKQITLTAEQKQFAQDNYTSLTHEQIAIKLGVAVTTVQRYCNRVGLMKLKPQVTAPPQKRIISFNQPVKPPRPRADHTNITYEQRIERWISESINADSKTFVPVKCLKEWQMKYVMNNHERQTAQQMAERLEVNVLCVKLFCQANAIQPAPSKVKRYNGPQKKTA